MRALWKFYEGILPLQRQVAGSALGEMKWLPCIARPVITEATRIYSVTDFWALQISAAASGSKTVFSEGADARGWYSPYQTKIQSRHMLRSSVLKRLPPWHGTTRSIRPGQVDTNSSNNNRQTGSRSSLASPGGPAQKSAGPRRVTRHDRLPILRRGVCCWFLLTSLLWHVCKGPWSEELYRNIIMAGPRCGKSCIKGVAGGKLWAPHHSLLHSWSQELRRFFLGHAWKVHHGWSQL